MLIVTPNVCDRSFLMRCIKHFFGNEMYILSVEIYMEIKQMLIISKGCFADIAKVTHICELSVFYPAYHCFFKLMLVTLTFYIKTYRHLCT